MLAVALYLAFGDLGRHKARIEALITRSVGRPFAIDGPFTLKLVPVVEVSAERVRLGNMQGGSQPQMLEFGKAVVQIGFWSLISGPPDVRVFELHDATVLLERGSDGRGNWILGATEAGDETGADDETDEEVGAPEVPVVVRSAQLHNVRVVYREAKKRDRVVQLDKLIIAPGREGLLAIAGEGKLDVYPLSLKGELGPLKSLLSARDLHIDMKGSLGRLALDINGVVGRLDPLDGADVTLKVVHPELGSMLQRLELPVIADGTARIEGRLKDDGALTRLDFNAKVGNLTASSKGTIKTLSLVGADLTLRVEHTEVGVLLKAWDVPVIATGPMQIDTRIKDVGKRRQLDFAAKLGDLEARGKVVGADLEFEASAADAARLARVFDVSGVPASPLTVSGHTVSSRKQIRFEMLTADIAGTTVSVKGTMQRAPDRKAALQFEMAAEDLAKLKETWPPMKVSSSGAIELTKDRIEAKDLQVVLGENHVAGSLLWTGEPRHLDAQLTSPRLDLTPIIAKDQPAETPTAIAPSKKKFMFDETPLHFDKIQRTDAKVHLSIGELVLGERSFKDIDSNLKVDHGKITFDIHATGAHGGELAGAGTLATAGDGMADLDMKLDLRNVRASFTSEGLAPADVPPLGVAMNLKIHGSTPRQMASGANGYLLLTQGAGKTRSGLISTFGGGVVTQLAQKLNPFARDDPFQKLDCTIARADIVNGEVAVKPVVVQTEKVTIMAHGNIDLRTEKLLLNFNTRPRKGIGVSPGMFTNPLIRLEGTLVSPKIGVGAKGMASGALAAATGGMTVLAVGVVDRMAGEIDICKKTLEAATTPGPP